MTKLRKLGKFLLPDYEGERQTIVADMNRRAMALHMGDYIAITEAYKRKGTR